MPGLAQPAAQTFPGVRLVSRVLGVAPAMNAHGAEEFAKHGGALFLEAALGADNCRGPVVPRLQRLPGHFARFHAAELLLHGAHAAIS